MSFKIIRHNKATFVRKMHENVFPGAPSRENLRLLSETTLRVNSHCATFFMDFTT